MTWTIWTQNCEWDVRVIRSFLKSYTLWLSNFALWASLKSFWANSKYFPFLQRIKRNTAKIREQKCELSFKAIRRHILTPLFFQCRRKFSVRPIFSYYFLTLLNFSFPQLLVLFLNAISTPNAQLSWTVLFSVSVRLGVRYSLTLSVAATATHILTSVRCK